MHGSPDIIQKCSTADRINEVGKQRSKAYIRKEMVRHVNPIVTIKQNKCTCDHKANDILRHVFLFADIRQHGKREHHGRYGHISTGPAFIIIIISRKIRNHLPPVTVF